MFRLEKWIKGIPVFPCMPLFYDKRVCMALITLVACFLTACHTDTRYHVYQTIPGVDGWNKSDSLVFHLPANFPKGEYQLEVGLRNTGGYPYRDIWLSVTRIEEDSLLVCSTDTLHFYLADEDGRWAQEGAIGGLYQQTFLCETPVIFAKDSVNRSFRMTHLMKRNPLPGISDAGIRLFFTGRVNAEEDK